MWDLQAEKKEKKEKDESSPASDKKEKVEEVIDFLYHPSLHEAKPRSYRRTARKSYLQVAQKKTNSRKVIRRAIRRQLQFLRRDIAGIHSLLDAYEYLPFDKYQLKTVS